MVGLEETLARIALRNDGFICSLTRSGGDDKLDPKICALARLAALIVLDGATTSFLACVQDAQAAGASPAEIVGTLVTVLPSVGLVRASWARRRSRSRSATSRTRHSRKATQTGSTGAADGSPVWFRRDGCSRPPMLPGSRWRASSTRRRRPPPPRPPGDHDHDYRAAGFDRQRHAARGDGETRARRSTPRPRQRLRYRTCGEAATRPP